MSNDRIRKIYENKRIKARAILYISLASKI